VIFGEHCSGDHRRIPVAMRGDPISERHRPRMLHQQDIAGAGEEAHAAGAVAPREEVGTAQAVLQRPRFQNLDDIALATGPRHVMDGSGDRIGDLAGGFDPPFVRQRWKACRHPADSMMSMFWTAAPEAPLPRLSRTATRLTCSPPGVPNTKSFIVSLPASSSASMRAIVLHSSSPTTSTISWPA